MGSPMKQDYSKVKSEVLESLFTGYLKSGGVAVFNLSDIISKYSFSLTEVGNYLLQNRWIKNEVFKPKEFFASITINGIKEVEQGWLDYHFSKIIATLIMNGNKKTSVMETFEFEPKDFQIAADISKAFLEIGYSDIEIKHEDILVMLNSEGWEHYNDKKLNSF